MVGLMAVILIVIMMNKRTKLVINKFPNLCFRKNHQYKSAFIPRWDAERKFTEAEVCSISILIKSKMHFQSSSSFQVEAGRSAQKSKKRHVETARTSRFEILDGKLLHYSQKKL